MSFDPRINACNVSNNFPIETLASSSTLGSSVNLLNQIFQEKKISEVKKPENTEVLAQNKVQPKKHSLRTVKKPCTIPEGTIVNGGRGLAYNPPLKRKPRKYNLKTTGALEQKMRESGKPIQSKLDEITSVSFSQSKKKMENQNYYDNISLFGIDSIEFEKTNELIEQEIIDERVASISFSQSKKKMENQNYYDNINLLGMNSTELENAKKTIEEDATIGKTAVPCSPPSTTRKKRNRPAKINQKFTFEQKDLAQGTFSYFNPHHGKDSSLGRELESDIPQQNEQMNFDSLYHFESDIHSVLSPANLGSGHYLFNMESDILGQNDQAVFEPLSGNTHEFDIHGSLDDLPPIMLNQGIENGLDSDYVSNPSKEVSATLPKEANNGMVIHGGRGISCAPPRWYQKKQ